MKAEVTEEGVVKQGLGAVALVLFFSRLFGKVKK